MYSAVWRHMLGYHLGAPDRLMQISAVFTGHPLCPHAAFVVL